MSRNNGSHEDMREEIGLLKGTVEALCEKVDGMASQLDELRQEVAKAKGVLTVAKWIAPLIGGGSGFTAAYLKDWLHR